jgi:hypothetical protein
VTADTEWVGTYVWDTNTGGARTCAGIDLAMELGGDQAIIVVGRCGMASKWITPTGEHIDLPQSQFCVQIDSWRSLKKGNTIEMANTIEHTCKDFGVDWNYVAIDASGIGRGIADLVASRHPGVILTAWGAGSTHTKLREQDKDYCDETISGLAAELWMCVRSWLEVSSIKAAPTLDVDKITQQLISRRRKSAGLGKTGLPMFRLEPKDEYRRRMKISPDHVDALALCVHAARARTGERQTLTKRKPIIPISYEVDVDNIKTIDFSKEG